MTTEFERIEVILTARDKTLAAFQRMGRSIRTIREKLQPVVNLTRRFGFAFTAATAVGVKMFGDIAKASRLLREPIQQVQLLSETIKTLEPSATVDKIQEGLLTLQERFAEAREGAGEAAEVFSRLGLDSSLDKPTQQLEEVRRALQSLQSDSERLQFTRVLFGDEDGNAITGYLRASRQEIEGIQASLKDSGKLFTDKDVENMTAASTALTTLRNEAGNAAQLLFAHLSPAIASAANFATAFLRTIKDGGFINLKDTVFFKLVDLLTKPLRFGFNTLKEAAKGAGDAVKDFLTDEEKVGERVANLAKSEFAEFSNSAKSFKENLAEVEAETQRAINNQKALAIAAANAGGVIDSVYDQTTEKIRIQAEEIKKAMQAANASPVTIQGRGPTENVLPDGSGNTVRDDTHQDRVARLQEMTRVSALMRETTQQAIVDFDTLGEAANGPLKNLQVGLTAVSGLMSAFGDAVSFGSERAFKRFQQFQVAVSSVAAIAGAVTAAGSPAVAAQGPIAVFAAYANVAAQLFKGVAAIKKIRIGGGSSSAAGAGSGASAPVASPTSPNAAVPNTSQGPTTVLNATIVGSGGTVTVDSLRQFLDILNSGIPGFTINENVIDEAA